MSNDWLTPYARGNCRLKGAPLTHGFIQSFSRNFRSALVVTFGSLENGVLKIGGPRLGDLEVTRMVGGSKL